MPLDHSEFVIGIATSLLGFLATMISVGVTWTKEADAESRRIRLLDPDRSQRVPHHLSHRTAPFLIQS
jgi:hypothetical protein